MLYSTDDIWRGSEEDRCLSDDLNAIESDIAGKADEDHTHDGFAAADHEHTGYAEADHTHSEYAPVSHEHTGYATSNHGHTPASIGAAPAAHSHDYAAPTHSHAQSDIPGLEAALAAKAAGNHAHTIFPSESSAAAYKLVYVATTGDDDNDGFTQATAMSTIKGVIKKYADFYKALDIRLLDGTYTEDTWSISVDQCNLSIRSASENKDACTLNLSGNIETNVNKLRLYNMTINVTATNVRAVSVTAGDLYAYNVRFNVPENTDASCVNVYNGCSAFLMNCVLNSGTGSSAGAAVYGNQALMVKVINCTSERKNNVGVHAHNGSDIWYTDTINATTKAKESSWGKCTVR